MTRVAALSPEYTHYRYVAITHVFIVCVGLLFFLLFSFIILK